MDIATTLYDMCGENGTNGRHLSIFSVAIAFVCNFIAPHPSLYIIELVLVVLAMPVKSYLKWRAI